MIHYRADVLRVKLMRRCWMNKILTLDRKVNVVQRRMSLWWLGPTFKSASVKSRANESARERAFPALMWLLLLMDPAIIYCTASLSANSNSGSAFRRAHASDSADACFFLSFPFSLTYVRFAGLFAHYYTCSNVAPHATAEHPRQSVRWIFFFDIAHALLGVPRRL